MLRFTRDSLKTQERLQISAVGTVLRSPSVNTSGMNIHTEENPCKRLKNSLVLEEHVLEWNDMVWEILLMLPMEFSKISSSFRSQRGPDIAPVSAESGWAFLLWYLIELFCFKRQSLWVVSLSRGWMLARTGFHCSEGATHLLLHGNLKSKLQDASCTLKSGCSFSRIHTEMLFYIPNPQLELCRSANLWFRATVGGLGPQDTDGWELWKNRRNLHSLCWLIKSEAAQCGRNGSSK